MHGVAAEQLIDAGSVDILRADRPGFWHNGGERRFGLLGQHQTAQSALRIAQGSRHRVQAVEPQCAARLIRIGARRLFARRAALLKIAATALTLFVALVVLGTLGLRRTLRRAGEAEHRAFRCAFRRALRPFRGCFARLFAHLVPALVLATRALVLGRAGR